MDKVSIVIINYNGWAMTHQLLFDIYNKCSLNLIHEVIVVNNGCTEPESFTGLEWWMGTKMLPIRELRIEENIGFLLGANSGLKEAKGEIVCLISNDVRVYGDIVSFIHDEIQSNSVSFIGGRYYDHDTGWNTFDGRIYPYLEGWLLAGHKHVWEGVGYFDERFAPNDFEDVDISTKAHSLGYFLVPLPVTGYAHHLSGRTLMYNADREELTKKNREKFREKWLGQENVA